MKQFIMIKMLGVALFTLSHDVISGEMIICSSKSVWWLPPKSIQLSWRNVWRRRKKKKFMKVIMGSVNTFKVDMYAAGGNDWLSYEHLNSLEPLP